MRKKQQELEFMLLQNKLIDFTEISPHLNIRISSMAKKLALRLDTHARVVHLVIPKRASLKKAYEFAREHKSWIDNKIELLPPVVGFTNDSIIPIMGKNKILLINKIDKGCTKIKITDNNIIVNSQLNDLTPRITRAIKQYASQELYLLTTHKAAQINRKINKFSLREMRTRWGSCSVDGNISLSWRLVFAPIAAFDYVVAHEVAHLIHPNHSPAFWKLCQELSVDYNTGKNWMYNNGNILNSYTEYSL